MEAYQAGRVVGMIIMTVLLLGGIGFFIFSLVKAFTRRTTAWIATAVAMGVLGIGAVVVAAAGLIAFALNAEAGKAKTEKVLTSTDGLYSISVPGNWKSIPELNDEASIEGGSHFADRYAIVIVEKKEDLAMSLADYAELIAGDLKEGAGDTAALAPEPLVVGGFPAIRHRISGRVERVNVTYHHTCVETPKALCQIMCWSLKSDEQSAKPVFDKVAASFAEKPE